MMNRFASAMNVSSRACSLCAGSFCADKNNAMLLDNAIALSIFICLSAENIHQRNDYQRKQKKRRQNYAYYPYHSF